MFKISSSQLASQEAYKFLKKYIGNQSLNIAYLPDRTFPYQEFARDRIILNDQVEIISQTSNQEIEQLNQQITQLLQQNQALQNQVNELNDIINGVPGEEIADRAAMIRTEKTEIQMEAKVEQPTTNLSPK